MVNYDSLGGGWKDVELVSERVCFLLRGGGEGETKRGGRTFANVRLQAVWSGERSFEWVVCQWSRSTTIH